MHKEYKPHLFLLNIEDCDLGGKDACIRAHNRYCSARGEPLVVLLAAAEGDIGKAVTAAEDVELLDGGKALRQGDAAKR